MCLPGRINIAPFRELFGDYVQGLVHLPELVRRMSFKRRNLDDELAEAALRGSLRRAFGGWQLLLFGVATVVGTGIYSGNGSLGWKLTGPSAVVSYALAGVPAFCMAVIYGEWVTEYPVSGGGFTYCMLTFGELPAFLTLSNLVLSYVVGMAGVAKNLAAYLSSYTDNSQTFLIDIGSPGGWTVDYFAFAAVLVATVVLSLGAREYAFVVSGSTLLKLTCLLVVIVASFSKADASNLSPFMLAEEQSHGNGGVEGIFQGVALVVYGYLGFDALTNAAEEAEDPAELPMALVGTVLVSALVYIPVALSFVMMAPFVGAYACSCTLVNPNGQCNERGRVNLSRIFLSPVGTPPADPEGLWPPMRGCWAAVGMPWVHYFIATVGLMGTAGGLLVGLYSLARLVMVAARDWLLPPCLAVIYPRTQTPLRAQLLVGAVVAPIALLVPINDLFVLVNFSSMFAMWMVCNALMYRRYFPDVKLRYTRYGTVETVACQRRMAWALRDSKMSPLLQKALVWAHIILITGTSVGLAVYWRVTSGSVKTTAFVGAWALVTLSFQLVCPLEYQPAAKWAVPWWAMPWLPSLAIALIIFSLGSLDKTQMWRIGVWFGIVLAFYLLYSLPVGYIKRRKLDYVNTEQMNVVELQYNDGKWVTPSGGSYSSTIGPMASLSAPSIYSPKTQSVAAASHISRLGQGYSPETGRHSMPRHHPSVGPAGSGSVHGGVIASRAFSGSVHGGGAGSRAFSSSGALSTPRFAAVTAGSSQLASPLQPPQLPPPQLGMGVQSQELGGGVGSVAAPSSCSAVSQHGSVSSQQGLSSLPSRHSSYGNKADAVFAVATAMRRVSGGVRQSAIPAAAVQEQLAAGAAAAGGAQTGS